MTRAALCTASFLQALAGVLLLRLGPGAAALGALITVTGLLGLLSQHPKYAGRTSMTTTAISLNALVAAWAAILVVPAAIGFLWIGTGASFGLLASVLIALAAGGANITCLVMISRRSASPG